MSTPPEILASAAAELAGEAQRRRVPAAERREELIEAAVVEFARGGLYGTPVGQIARRVGVAQPYVFSLFPTKRDLFLAAVERGFDRVADTFRSAAAAYARGESAPDVDGPLMALGRGYVEMLGADRDSLMLQHQSYAACGDEQVRTRVRSRYAQLIELARELSGASDEELDEFMQHGMALNVAAALGVEDLSSACEWVKAEITAVDD